MISFTRSMSHAFAASLAATSSFVTPASAETTTIGFRSRRPATMSIAAATRSASPTEVPPNLMTIMRPSSALRAPSPRERGEGLLGPRPAQRGEGGRRPGEGQASQQPLRLQQLRVEDRCAGGAANRVVHQRDHADVEQRAWTEPADRYAHAVLAVSIEARLGAIIFR